VCSSDLTVDEHGTLYLVAEQGSATNSQLIVLSSVPEPDALLLAGAGLALLVRGQRRLLRRRAR
jgi:hypothetical protein